MALVYVCSSAAMEQVQQDLLAEKHPEATIVQGMRATSAALIPEWILSDSFGRQ